MISRIRSYTTTTALAFFAAFFAVLFSVVLIPLSAFADSGLPMIAITMPLMVATLIPVIALEMIVFRSRLQTSIWEALKVTGISNLVSTLLGIPLTWLVLVLLQLVSGGGQAYGIETALQKFLAVTWQSPWLIPYEEHLSWMVPLAMITLLIPFFFISCWIETIISKRLLLVFGKSLEKSKIRAAVWQGNLLSYGILELLMLSWLYFSD